MSRRSILDPASPRIPMGQPLPASSFPGSSPPSPGGHPPNTDDPAEPEMPSLDTIATKLLYRPTPEQRRLKARLM